ncbi:winged helix-turn-helix domain-containing protein [Halorubrum sp. ARQ200]|uniref:winged helix-turn-helix domain-containing protein n=1 Tax=Halorubrum sp. ARQ200 TaxID=1855872 RepID=UPI0010F9CC54|nr:winged helix-turn-helix domain-containing protein [Halorubrum sp. ARQ200]TKX45176.1 ArsR family transcriptional regulator [Halorubrum sp. ARQ200]
MAGRKETISDKEILIILKSATDPVLTTSELADETGFSLNGIRKRLYSLEEKGLVDEKKAGNSPVWWITEDGADFVDEK